MNRRVKCFALMILERVHIVTHNIARFFGEPLPPVTGEEQASSYFR